MNQPTVRFCRLGLSIMCAALLARADVPRSRENFDRDWRFMKGDPAVVSGRLAYEHIKPWILPTGQDLIALSDTTMPPGRAPSHARPTREPYEDIPYARPDFDDTAWRKLHLPHDWGIEEAFSIDLPGSTGKLPYAGVGWYRKRFPVAEEERGKSFFLEIDGAMSYSAVWVNGRLVGGWPYGYTSYRLDLTGYLRYGAENVIAIRLDNPPDASRWYPGSGLYRHVWLTKTGPVRIAHWGVVVNTPIVTKDHARLSVDVRLENVTGTAGDFDLVTEVYAAGANGRRVGEAMAKSDPVALRLEGTAGRQFGLRTCHLDLQQMRLWSPTAPNLYVAKVSVRQGDRLVDAFETTFGVRHIVADAAKGLLVNGVPTPLKGVCLHHDLGGIGTAVHEAAIARQLTLLKEMGCNAIRTSHNAPAPELLDLCDRMGFLVLDEAFDCWHRGKAWPRVIPETSPDIVYLDYGKLFEEWHERDLRAMVRRDRNHPSVFAWSIGNEVMEFAYPEGWVFAQRLAGIVREEDRSRPITAGINERAAAYAGFQTALDWMGFNYKPDEYANFTKLYPSMPVFGSETASCLSSRGEYFFPHSDDPKQGRAHFQITSYDTAAEFWANVPDKDFAALDDNPNALGEFVWTGFDYLGEPTPYYSGTKDLNDFENPDLRELLGPRIAASGHVPPPSRSSYFGIIDLAGIPKDRFYLYQSRWRPEHPMAHIAPHWTWPHRVGEVTPVQVYTSGDEAELFLNGRSLGRKRKGPREYRLRWNDVVYQPGELRVVAYKQGAVWSEDKVVTAGPAARLEIKAERNTLAADGRDLVYFRIRVLDQAGHPVPQANPRIRVTLQGPGELIAMDNGDPTDLQAFASPSRRAFNGMLVATVRSLQGAVGQITVTAAAESLSAGTAEIAARTE